MLRRTWPLAHILGSHIELRYGVPLIGVALGFLLVEIELLNRYGAPHTVAYWGMLSIGFAAIFYAAYTTREFDGTALVLDNGTIALHKWLSTPRTIPTADVKRVVLCRVKYGMQGDVAERAAFMLNAQGKCVMSLAIGRWADDDVDHLWQLLGVRPEGSFSRLIYSWDLPAAFPHAFDKAS